MKKLTTLTLGLLLILGSCAKDEETSTTNPQQVTLKSLNDKNGLLFTYSTATERIDKAKIATTQLASEADDLITNSSDITHVISYVETGNGKGLLTSMHYVNVARNTVVASYELNPSTSLLENVGGGGPIYNPSTGEPVNPAVDPAQVDCPDGYTHLNDCQKTNDSGFLYDCIRFAIANYEADHSASGTVNNYSITNSSNSVRICVKTGSQDSN